MIPRSNLIQLIFILENKVVTVLNLKQLQFISPKINFYEIIFTFFYKFVFEAVFKLQALTKVNAIVFQMSSTTFSPIKVN